MRPRHVLPPHPAVGAEDGAEGAQLEPAGIELARLRHRMEEAAHVRAPVRHARQAGIEPERDLRVERGEVVVDVARPARRAESLHPRRPRAAQQEDALVGPVRGLTTGEGLVAEAVVDVVQEGAITGVELRRRGRSLAAVEPPARHPERGELAVGRPPPGTDGRIGEVEIALALAIVGGPPRPLARSAVAFVEQIPTRLRLGKERRILVGDDLEVLPPRLLDEGGRIRPERRLKDEMPHAAIPALRFAVGREVDEAVAGDPLLANRAREAAQLLRVLEVARGLEKPQGPAGRKGWPAEELGSFEHDST